VVANYLVLTKVDADPALSAEQSRPKGRLVLPIFIRQGVAAGHEPLPWIGGPTAVLTRIFAGRTAP
jgi:hypothetical protein